MQFRHLETQQELETHLTDFFRHHVRRFAATGRQSLCATPEFCQFMRALVAEFGPSDRLRFGVLELDGRPLAWHFGFEVNGKFLLYQHTFDLDASDYTPGELLLWNLLAYAKDHFIREFDFGTGDELYKTRFANYSRETFSIFIEPPRFAGRIRGLRRSLQGYVQPLYRTVKQFARSRATMRAFRSMRIWAMGTMAGLRQADKNGVLWQYCLHLIREVIRDSVWSKQSIEVFAPDVLRSSHVTPPVGTDDSPEMEVGAAGFGDLVDLAWDRPDILLPSELPRCRKRLKKGARVYITKKVSRVVMLCWASTSTAAAVASCTARSGIRPDSLVMLIDECWSAHDSDLASAHRLLLSILANEASNLMANVPVYFGSDQPLLRRELERQGFVPEFHITRYKALGRLHRESVRLHPGNSLHSSQSA